MSLPLYGIIGASLVVFLAGCAWRVIQYARTPPHLRWELYPVPHEPPERAVYGGSYHEETDWWTRPRRRSFPGMLRSMLAEMVFIRALYEHNRRLWVISFPFHFGLYLLAFAALLLGVLVAAGVSPTGPQTAAVFRGLDRLGAAAGLAGFILTWLGALGLLLRRFTDPALRSYTAPADLFNLLFFLLALGLTAVGRLTAAPDQAGIIGFLAALVRLEPPIVAPPLMIAGIVLSALLLAYIPLTHMSHFIGKYFTWHEVRWNDEPNLRGYALERRLVASLAQRPTWTARHVGASEGNRSWNEVAAPVRPAVPDPPEGGKEEAERGGESEGGGEKG